MVFDDSNANKGKMLFVGTFTHKDLENDEKLGGEDEHMDANEAPIDMGGDIPDNNSENKDSDKEADDPEDGGAKGLECT